MKSMRSLLLLALYLLPSCGPSSAVTPDPGPEPTPSEKSYAQVYTTSVSGARMEPSQLVLGKPEDAIFYKVALTGESFQSVDGFGLAITQASCYNLMLMTAADRSAFLEEIFSREKGLGSSLIRVCIGGSDFSLDEFTWCDTPGMENFAVHPSDEQWVFPILDEIYRINPDVTIIGSP
ncbi:MAG: glucosylceramidase, partial [Bacteroidales bacterium]|nr:glucosylceramidase [Bacteroidales bacterium]